MFHGNIAIERLTFEMGDNMFIVLTIIIALAFGMFLAETLTDEDSKK